VFAKAATGCLLAAAAIAVAACGSSKSSSNTIDIYSSLPLQGSSNAQTIPTVNGIKLALDQAGGKAGTFKVNYQSLDDSTASAAQWDPAQCAANARKVAQDSNAVYYIGDFNSGCSKITIPILNQAGVPQVSPANTYVGLTTNEPGSVAGEPGKYYPTGKRTYLRIVPRDSIQAASDLLAMKRAGCTRVAIANDKQAYGAGLGTLIELEKGFYGVTVVSNTGIDPKAPNFRTYASTIKSQGADCFFFAGITADGAVQITKDVNAALPTAKIFGGDGVCTSAWTNPSKGGVPASIDSKLECTVATLDLKAYPGGLNPFLPAYKAKYGVSNPDPYAIYGYEDMKLALDTITTLASKGKDKSAVLAALFATTNRSSVLGTYGFDKNGDTTLKSYGLYKVGSDGNPLFLSSLTPSKVV
jgi:branched-chain amino acid transport system substrate-binding protein